MFSRTAPCLLLVAALVLAALAPAVAAPSGAAVTGGEAPHPEIAASATGGPSNAIYPVHFDPHTVQLGILVAFSVLMAGFLALAAFTIATSLPRHRRTPGAPPSAADRVHDRRAA